MLDLQHYQYFLLLMSLDKLINCQMKKIKHPLVKGVVKEIVPQIYCAEVDDDYDRAMLFCRY